MGKAIVFTFNERNDADDAIDELNDLQEMGEVLVYKTFMIHKKRDHKVEYLHQDDRKARRYIAGGSRIGMFWSWLTGVCLGIAPEEHDMELDRDLIQAIGEKLTTGVYAILLDVGHYSGSLIVTLMTALDGKIYNINVGEAKGKFEQQLLAVPNVDALGKEKKLGTIVDMQKTMLLEVELVEIKEKKESSPYQTKDKKFGEKEAA